MANCTNQELYGLKQYKLDSAEDFDRENQILQELKHDNIIKSISSQKLQILLEYCKNGDIFHYLNNQEPWPDELIRYYMKQLIQALKYAHQRQFAHMDIKLQNILLDNNFNIKLADWSFGQKFQRGQQFKQVRGTPSYMAPEMISQKSYYANCVDIFSLGVVLFVMKLQVMPFYQSAIQDDPLYRNIIQKNFLKYWHYFEIQLKKQISHEFKDLIQGMLSNKPEERFTIEEIEQSSYLNGRTMSEDEVIRFMSRIKLSQPTN